MYRKGLYATEEKSDIGQSVEVSMAHVVIGTAPVHMTANPAAVTNVPVLCNNITEAKNKLGYSTDFEKYTLCQAMYTHFMLFGSAPVVFINVLDVSTHKTAVSSASKTVTENTVVIDDAVIVSSLVVKQNNTAIAATDYDTAWSDGKLIISFKETTTGTVTVEYDKANPAGVTAEDVIGSYSTATEVRKGIEVVNDVNAKTGAVPILLSAPQFSETDTVGAALIAKTTEIGGVFKAFALLDLASPAGSTRASAITARRARTEGENCAYFFPRIKRGDYTVSFSAWAAAAIMYRATLTGGVFANGVDNYRMNIDDVVLSDGTSVYYNQPDGNELVAEGIITVISRNGYYGWGNNTGAYPTLTNPESRWVNMRLAFIYTENDFIASNAGREIDTRTMEDLMTDENIKLGAWSSNGYIIGGSMSFLAADNTADDISNGVYILRTNLAPNVKAETVTNIFKYDKDAVAAAIEALAGNGGTE